MPRKRKASLAASVAIPSEPVERDGYSFKARFGALIAATGIAGVPRALCHFLGELGLSYADLGFITHILSYRWTSAFPYPSQRKLAEQGGVGRTGIQRRIYALQELGYLQIAERYDQQDGRRTSNGYDLTPLLERLNELILRDWDTVWKHRDPLVSDDDDDSSYPPPSVDNSSPSPQSEAGASPQKWVGHLSQKAVGASRDLAAGPAQRSGHKQDPANLDTEAIDPPSQDQSINEKQIRATTLHPSTEKHSPPGPTLTSIDERIATCSDQFHDRRHLAANRTRALHLYQQSGLPLDEFVAVLGEAAERTLNHSDRIAGPHAMPYFFGVVKGVLRERGLSIDERPTQSSGREGPVDLGRLATILGRRLDARQVEHWLAGAQVLDWDTEKGYCEIGVTDPDGARKLGLEYHRLLSRAVCELVGRSVDVEVRWVGTPGNLVRNEVDGP